MLGKPRPRPLIAPLRQALLCLFAYTPRVAYAGRHPCHCNITLGPLSAQEQEAAQASDAGNSQNGPDSLLAPLQVGVRASG